MSAGYHWSPCPTGAARAFSGWQVWFGIPAAGYVLWLMLGWWLLAAPVVLAVAVVAALGVRRRRAQRLRAAVPVSVSVVPVPRPLTRCLGCGWRDARRVMDVAGHRVPVCPSCEDVAWRRLAAGHVQIEAAPSRSGDAGSATLGLGLGVVLLGVCVLTGGYVVAHHPGHGWAVLIVVGGLLAWSVGAWFNPRRWPAAAEQPGRQLVHDRGSAAVLLPVVVLVVLAVAVASIRVVGA